MNAYITATSIVVTTYRKYDPGTDLARKTIKAIGGKNNTHFKTASTLIKVSIFTLFHLKSNDLRFVYII
jgi:hypothetical protein